MTSGPGAVVVRFRGPSQLGVRRRTLHARVR
jgi:hypothetical protein